MEKGKIYLIPTLLAPDTEIEVLPAYLRAVIPKISLFFVENLRSARRFISGLKLDVVINDLEFWELNKDTQIIDILEGIEKINQGQDAGILSEAGCPAIADPGNLLVGLAHQQSIEVIPLVGPCSITLALMASGLNGQSFAFNGYLPIDKQERQKAIKYFEKHSLIQSQTQIFIETPYRNMELLQEFVKHCHSDTNLCIAANLTGQNEWIRTQKIKNWKNNTYDLHKKPAIFLMQAAKQI